MKHEDKLKLAHKKLEDKLATEKTRQEAVLSDKEQRLAEIQTIKESIEKLADALEVKVDVDLQPLIEKLQVLSQLPDSFKEIKELSSKLLADSEKEVNIKGFRELWETLVKSNNDLHRLTKSQVLEVSTKFADLQVYLEQLTETINQGQEPGDYKPVRIVVGGDGVPLAFLSQFPSSRGGGGGGSNSGGLTDTELRATPVPVSATDLDIRNLVFATDKVDASGSIIALDAATLAALETINAVQSGIWDVRLQDGAGTDLTSTTSGAKQSLDVNITSGSSSGTEYVEDAASPTDPSAGALSLRRRDSLAAETGTDGDWVTANATNKGEMYVKHVDTLPISAASLPIPSGASTSAIQTTQQTALDAIKTAVEILDNVVSGSEAQVDIVAPLPAGTNNIGDVDIASIAAGTNQIGSIVPDRPSQGTGRTRVHATLNGVTGTNTIHTVTTGKTLYITDVTYGFRRNVATSAATNELQAGGVMIAEFYNRGAVIDGVTGGTTVHGVENYHRPYNEPLVATTTQVVRFVPSDTNDLYSATISGYEV